MKNLNNQQGVALVTSLLLTLITLAIIMALLYMVTWQTKLSAAHKRYKTAIEASQGGVDIMTQQVIPFIFNNGTTAGIGLSGVSLVAGSNACLKAKLNSATAEWGTVCGSDTNLFDPTQKTDITFKLSGVGSYFSVYSKIVDTVPGNSDLSGFELLDSGSGVAGMPSGVSPKHIPATYRIEVQGQSTVNPQEKAALSVLYAY